MRCAYEIEVRAQCPVNPADTDLYQFVIESESLIEVERIAAFSRRTLVKPRSFRKRSPSNAP